ncbi:zinc-binding metallopeptidase family protein [Rubripirellula tenax]|nr:putative zinc-binding metallopeptidase [Rubripirellula tenax]
MRTFKCRCGNTTFFENSRCVACDHALGWCPACDNMTTLLSTAEGKSTLQCGHQACGVTLVKCRNYTLHGVCNRCCLSENSDAKDADLCDYCRYNDTIPDLSVPGNRDMWLQLEEAKRRLLYTLDLLKLPYGTKEEGFVPPLAFDFKADKLLQDKQWRSLGKEERVYTGHADGKITINLREADSVERERNRVLFQEAHRTVVGHFRHEIAHYYWQMLVQGACESECKAVFGDHAEPTYSEAQKLYYEDGPKPHWQAAYISAYATMHPWEDFAETFATYLDMVSVLDTAWNVGIHGGCDPTSAELPTMVDAYIRLGVVLNETNRAMGLIDLVPEILTPAVVTKLGFVHDLVRKASLHS